MKRLFVFVLLSFFVFSSLYALGGSEKEADDNLAKGKDTLIVALDGEPQQLDPYAHSNQNGLVVSRLVYEPLFRSDLACNRVQDD